MYRWVGFLCAVGGLPAQAMTADLCDLAAAQAAAESEVPLPLLRAITRVETGRDGAPWPWSLNINGSGEWFSTAEEAVTAAERAVSEGATQIDIGCFQLNLRWHGAHFSGLDDMIDPMTNARHAARFLQELYSETGDWRAAAAAYHSRDADRGEAYAQRLEAAHEADAPAEVAPESPAPVRINGFPLLVAGQSPTTGSIVPRGRAMTPLIGGP